MTDGQNSNEPKRAPLRAVPVRAASAVSVPAVRDAGILPASAVGVPPASSPISSTSPSSMQRQTKQRQQRQDEPVRASALAARTGTSLVQQAAQDSLLQIVRHEGLDTVEAAFAYGGGEDLNKAGLGHRRRTRLLLPSPTGPVELYLKRYGPEPLPRRIGRMLLGRRLGPAREEFDNIVRVARAGVPTMTPVLCDEQEALLGPRRGFLIVSAVPGDALERCLDSFAKRNGEPAVARMTLELAAMVRRLHTAGLVHRDLYACHIFLHESPVGTSLCLIDLARVFAPRIRMRRWIVKDLAQLKYSMPRPWVADYWGVFMGEYLSGGPAAMAHGLQDAIDAKVAHMRRRDDRKRGATA